jgi:hypothetical protein
MHIMCTRVEARLSASFGSQQQQQQQQQQHSADSSTGPSPRVAARALASPRASLPKRRRWPHSIKRPPHQLPWPPIHAMAQVESGNKGRTALQSIPAGRPCWLLRSRTRPDGLATALLRCCV